MKNDNLKVVCLFGCFVWQSESFAWSWFNNLFSNNRERLQLEVQQKENEIKQFRRKCFSPNLEEKRKIEKYIENLGEYVRCHREFAIAADKLASEYIPKNKNITPDEKLKFILSAKSLFDAHQNYSGKCNRLIVALQENIKDKSLKEQIQQLEVTKLKINNAYNDIIEKADKKDADTLYVRSLMEWNPSKEVKEAVFWDDYEKKIHQDINIMLQKRVYNKIFNNSTYSMPAYPGYAIPVTFQNYKR